MVKRRVAIDAAMPSRTVSAPEPLAAPTVAATPSSPSHRSVATGPGATLVIRIPCGPNSWASDWARFANAVLAAP
jgi:hypothetical protein